ncbi:hypothetical protein KIP88_39575 [Bradyrhizobium sp. SRL28]|uniref:hypothetical protein n=1 Tax=Bradyrhizobium sp. SRL28 TaxID=2836178 RepID=UPI001BDF5417|nr:hypothetical protein [Bradyrhizobium sp. SRL28]MBT1516530.1 hypothetical protein [Bradyrhizobium sp. SRL28]
MQISKPDEALQLPEGSLEVVSKTERGRVCEPYKFTSAEVVDAAGALLRENIELVGFAAQAEILAFRTNHFGWKHFEEAFALSGFRRNLKSR